MLKVLSFLVLTYWLGGSFPEIFRPLALVAQEHFAVSIQDVTNFCYIFVILRLFDLISITLDTLWPSFG